jgi:CBS domain-containing protein
MPKRPIQELIVALAGPAVNIVIAGLLLAILLPTVGVSGLAAVPLRSGGFLQQLLIVNITLVAFNMLPAFPLDGGRVFRALLAMVFGHPKATRIAAAAGQFCAIGFGLLGLANPFMLVIAAFIFFSAAAEARQATFEEQFGGYRVRDGMVRAFRAVPANVRVRDWAEELLDGTQRDYPVIDNEMFVGMLRQDVMLEAVTKDSGILVADIMDRNVQSVDALEPLVSAIEKAAPSRGGTLPVTKDGLLVGLLDVQQMFDLAKAREGLRHAVDFAPAFTPRQHVTA